MTIEQTFEQTSVLDMRIETANVFIGHSPSDYRAEFHAALTNIARGSCMLTISPNEETNGPIGTIQVLVERPLIIGQLRVGWFYFERLIKQFRGSHARPITCSVEINRSLTLDRNGVLQIDETIDAVIIGVKWTIPLK